MNGTRTPSATFIGLDAAWKIDGNHSGVAVLRGGVSGVSLAALSAGLCSQSGVLDFIKEHACDDTVLAIDCSLVVGNRTGQRPCERQVASAFGRYHASCHTTNKGRPYWETGPRLVRSLARVGFGHGLPIQSAQGRRGRWLIEVYPHPAMVRLFGLDRILKYKKGNVGERRAGLADLARRTATLPALRPNALLGALLKRPLADVKGKALKRHEDTLDAVFCAYLAWHCWRWGERRNEVFGNLSTGYIVVPGPT